MRLTFNCCSCKLLNIGALARYTGRVWIVCYVAIDGGDDIMEHNDVLSVGLCTNDRSFCDQLKITTANSLSKHFSCYRNNGEASAIF